MTDEKKSLIDLTFYVLKANRSKLVENQGDQLLTLDLNVLPDSCMTISDDAAKFGRDAMGVASSVTFELAV